jgi:phosphoglycolate phosphatase
MSGASGRRPVVIFFDIDATLITTGGVGKTAMLDAARGLYGESFTIEGISFAGRLDPLLFEEMLALNGHPVHREACDTLFARYCQCLEQRLTRPIKGGPLPGVMDLLDNLRAIDGVTLGLLTGNFPETGAMKLRACGIDPGRFAVQVWGGDSPHTPPSRDHLPGVGLDRYHRLTGRPIAPTSVTVIGDTPHDISCARAHGCRSLGVATGQFTTPQLLGAGADHAVANLADTSAIISWLLPER